MMRKIHFKPMPVLTAVLAISVAILIALGVWQYQRLQWKTALLAEVEASVTAPPLTSLSDLQSAIETADPVDFRRISFSATPIEGASIFHLYKSQQGGIFWSVVMPLKSQGHVIFAKTDLLDNQSKDKAPHRVAAMGSETYTGYVRKVYDMGRVESWVKSQANPSTNRYFHFNQTGDWYADLPASSLKGFYIDIAPAKSAEDLPILRPEIANNHFDYMLTWWSFALIFIVIYLILHRRAGRLRFS